MQLWFNSKHSKTGLKQDPGSGSISQAYHFRCFCSQVESNHHRYSIDIEKKLQLQDKVTFITLYRCNNCDSILLIYVHNMKSSVCTDISTLLVLVLSFLLLTSFSPTRANWLMNQKNSARFLMHGLTFNSSYDTKDQEHVYNLKTAMKAEIK